MLQRCPIIFILLCAMLLTACQSAPAKKEPSFPTSERLDVVKGKRLASVSNEMRTKQAQIGQPAFIRIFKEERVLETWIKDSESEKYALYKQYPICKFSGDLGPKLAEGDGQAPEGFYEVGMDQLNPWSKYHLSFNLGYPNEYDRARMRTGSNLMVHGGCESIGCYAITDAAMEEVYLITEASIFNGHSVPVHIFPFRMTPRAMYMKQGQQWDREWANLREGYDAFERTKIPPRPITENYRYVFNTQDYPTDFQTALY